MIPCLIQTSRGEYLNPLEPWTFVPRIEDIAAALSKLARFTGHTLGDKPYTVAQHSVHVAELCPSEWRLAGLLHDAAEAYLGDMAGPLKHHVKFGRAHREAETRLQRRINTHFGVADAFLVPGPVKHADEVMLATERKWLMPPGDPAPYRWLQVKALDERIEPWPSGVARLRFLDRYEMLMRARMDGRRMAA